MRTRNRNTDAMNPSTSRSRSSRHPPYHTCIVPGHSQSQRLFSSEPATGRVNASDSVSSLDTFLLRVKQGRARREHVSVNRTFFLSAVFLPHRVDHDKETRVKERKRERERLVYRKTPPLPTTVSSATIHTSVVSVLSVVLPVTRQLARARVSSYSSRLLYLNLDHRNVLCAVYQLQYTVVSQQNDKDGVGLLVPSPATAAATAAALLLLAVSHYSLCHCSQPQLFVSARSARLLYTLGRSRCQP